MKPHWRVKKPIFRDEKRGVTFTWAVPDRALREEEVGTAFQPSGKASKHSKQIGELARTPLDR
jgi:hypothetical protein